MIFVASVSVHILEAFENFEWEACASASDLSLHHYNVLVTFCLHQMCDHLNSFDAYCQQESLEWCLEQKREA